MVRQDRETRRFHGSEADDNMHVPCLAVPFINGAMLVQGHEMKGKLDF
jgi:hypothetical protein